MQITESILGGDDFHNDFQRVIVDEFSSHEEAVLEQVVEHALEREGGHVGIVINDDKTKNHKACAFHFISDFIEDEGILILMYVDCEEFSGNGKA